MSKGDRKMPVRLDVQMHSRNICEDELQSEMLTLGCSRGVYTVLGRFESS